MTRRPASHPWPVPRRFVALAMAFAMVALFAACSRFNKPSFDDEPTDPISVHVTNQNFLDVNVYLVANGMTRRLGFVSGNNASTFSIPYSSARAGGVVLTAIPIGGTSGQQARTPSLNVGSGQVIEFVVAANLRQSAATVHDP